MRWPRIAGTVLVGLLVATGLGCTGAANEIADVPASIPEGSVPEDYVELATDDSGVPGLDSIDPFCRAWSEFAGSFQIVAVAAAFGTGSDREITTLEVVAAPMVVAAAEQFFATLPDELASEREVLADQFLGPFQRRSGAALDALISAGATAADIGSLTELWSSVLVTRDPDDPEPDLAIPDALGSLVDAAVDLMLTLQPPFRADERLASGARAPLTENYLALNCPDRGLLAGGDDIGE